QSGSESRFGAKKAGRQDLRWSRVRFGGNQFLAHDVSNSWREAAEENCVAKASDRVNPVFECGVFEAGSNHRTGFLFLAALWLANGRSAFRFGSGGEIFLSALGKFSQDEIVRKTE